MNKKLTAATLSIAMAVTMAPTMMQTASVNAASAAVQSLAGGAIAMAYVSTALNKMDNYRATGEFGTHKRENWLLKR